MKPLNRKAPIFTTIGKHNNIPTSRVGVDSQIKDLDRMINGSVDKTYVSIFEDRKNVLIDHRRTV